MPNGNIIYKYFKTIYNQFIDTGLDNVLAVEVSIVLTWKGGVNMCSTVFTSKKTW